MHINSLKLLSFALIRTNRKVTQTTPLRLIYLQSMFNLSSVYVQSIFSLCSIYLQSMFNLSSVYVQSIFSLCSVYLQSMFNLYSVYVQSLLNYFELSPSLFPIDLYTFTRKPMFLVVDSQNSVAFKVSWQYKS